MRPTMFAAGLILTATTAMAEPVTAEDEVVARATDRLHLGNGCVYTPNLLGQPDVWSLLYSEAGTTATCALTIYGSSAETAEPAAIAPVSMAAAVTPDTPTQTTVAVLSQPEPAPVVLAAEPRVQIKPGFLVGVFR